MSTTTTIRIITQYYENYNTSGSGEPYWKAKGGHEFDIDVNEDILMACGLEERESIIREMLVDQCTPMQKFDYLSHELVFHKPTKLSGLTFKEKLRKLYA